MTPETAEEFLGLAQVFDALAEVAKPPKSGLLDDIRLAEQKGRREAYQDSANMIRKRVEFARAATATVEAARNEQRFPQPPTWQPS